MMKMALFFPELFLLLSCLVIFLLTLGKMSSSTVKNITAASAHPWQDEQQYSKKYYCCIVSNNFPYLCCKLET
jgi:hypothetical protein